MHSAQIALCQYVVYANKEVTAFLGQLSAHYVLLERKAQRWALGTAQIAPLVNLHQVLVQLIVQTAQLASGSPQPAHHSVICVLQANTSGWEVAYHAGLARSAKYQVRCSAKIVAQVVTAPWKVQPIAWYALQANSVAHFAWTERVVAVLVADGFLQKMHLHLVHVSHVSLGDSAHQ